MPLIPVECSLNGHDDLVLLELQGKFETSAESLSGLELGDLQLDQPVKRNASLYVGQASSNCWWQAEIDWKASGSQETACRSQNIQRKWLLICKAHRIQVFIRYSTYHLSFLMSVLVINGSGAMYWIILHLFLMTLCIVP